MSDRTFDKELVDKLRRARAEAALERASKTADPAEAQRLRHYAAFTLYALNEDPLGDALARNGALEQRLDRLTAATFILNARLSDIETRVGAPAAPSIDDDWIALKDAAFRVGFSPSALRQWIAKGKVVWKKIGGRVFVSKASLPSAK